MKFRKLVKEELERARSNHSEMNSLHEAYAIIIEEVAELWDWVRKKSGDRVSWAIVDELVQIAAMAQRAVEDLYPEELRNGE